MVYVGGFNLGLRMTLSQVKSVVSSSQAQDRGMLYSLERSMKNNLLLYS